MTIASSAALLVEFESAKMQAKKLFAKCAGYMPSAKAVTRQAIAEALGQPPYDLNFVKDNFSSLVADLQVGAYGLYLEAERRVCGAVLEDFILSQGEALNTESSDPLLSQSFFVLDRFFLSLTQSRRTRAGSAFETVVTTLFEALGYPYTAQPDLSGSKPDFVLPNIGHYGAFAADCLIFTCKRTLRERWRQVVTEGMTGQAFYLATIDEGLSRSELQRMKDRNVLVVVPVELKDKCYPAALNVISFEVFFDHHLDPAVNRWKAHGVI